MNDELRQRTEDLNQANAFLEAVLTSMRVAAVAVDCNLTVQLWNEKAADLWGLRPDEVMGEFLFNLDIGLPLDKMKGCLRNVINGTSECEELTLDATNRRGKSIRCKVTCTPQFGFKKEIQGAIFLMEEITQRARPRKSRLAMKVWPPRVILLEVDKWEGP